MAHLFKYVLSAALILFCAGAGTPGLSNAGSWPATDGYPYYGQTVPFQWITPTGGTAVNLVDGDEGFAGPFPIGFTFPFYSTTRTSFYVSANGYISFDANGQEPVNQCPIPDTDTPNNLIALMWGDLITANPNSSVFYKSYNNPPSLPCPLGGGKCLVVQYVNFNFYSGEKAGTFEAILYENGNITIQFLDVGPNAGRQSTTGIEEAASDRGLTFACNTANSLSNSLAIQFKRNFLALAPEDLVIRGCNGQTGKNTFTLKNYTGVPGSTYDLSYNVTTGNASLTGPATVVANPTQDFEVTLTPAPCLPPGAKISATITATGQGANTATSTALINKTLYQSGVWDDLPPEPEYCRNDIVTGTWNGEVWSIAGKGASNVRAYNPETRTWRTVDPTYLKNLSLDNYARSGCQHGSKVYFYGDAVDLNFQGLWAFDMATQEVNQVSTGGPLTKNAFGPAWAYDPEAGLCYLTGGAESAVGNSRSAVYVYDPKTNTWPSTLPPMTTSRKLHAAFAFKRPLDNHKLLCVAGGMNTFNGQGTPLSTTQCYDLTSGGWNPQNDDLGALPGSWWGMGYTQRDDGPDPQLWLVSGVINGLLSDTTRIYNVTSGTWSFGGNLISGPVYRNSAVALNGKIFKLGGLVGLTQTCSADENMECSACGWWSEQVFLPVLQK